MKGKIGQETIIEKLVIILILMFFYFSLMFYLNFAASPDYYKKQILAKQICLMIDYSKPGTTIVISDLKEYFKESFAKKIVYFIKGKNEKIEISLIENQIIVGDYIYTFSKDPKLVHFTKEDERYIFKIQE